MLDRNRSGQFLFLGMVSAISGNAVAGISGSISGRVAVDSASQRLLSGFVTELAGGQYRVNLFAEDTAGDCLGFFFTASGCVPVNYTVITQNNVSGKLVPQSGLASPISGAFVNVPPATLSGVVANSGLSVTVFVANLSGVVANSGLNVTVPIASISGVVANSGLSVTVPIASISGLNAVVPPATLSGVVANSGLNVMVPKESLSGLIANSGLNVTVPIASVSGLNVVVPGATLSGTFFLASGAPVSIWSGQLSGQYTTARTVLDKSGYILGSGGWDGIEVESGVNARQALSVVLAAEAGTVSGAGTSTIRIGAANSGGTTRITGTVDGSGNRTAVALNLPS